MKHGRITKRRSESNLVKPKFGCHLVQVQISNDMLGTHPKDRHSASNYKQLSASVTQYCDIPQFCTCRVHLHGILNYMELSS